MHPPPARPMPTPPPQTTSTTPDDPAPEPDERRLGVSGTQVATSGLASVSAAFVASLFGVAGTIVGAAVVSVVATVGTAVYGRGIRRTTARLQQVQRLTATRGVGGAGRHAADGSDAGAGPGAGGPVELEVPPAGPGWWRRLSRRHLGLAGGVAAVLALSVGAVSLIELAGGQPLSGEASGGSTSVGALLPGGGGTTSDDDRGTGGGDGGDDDDDEDGTGTTTDPSGPTTTAPGAEDVRPGATAPEEGGDTTTTSSTVPTTATTAPPTTRSTVEPELAPEG